MVKPQPQRQIYSLNYRVRLSWLCHAKFAWLGLQSTGRERTRWSHWVKPDTGWQPRPVQRRPVAMVAVLRIILLFNEFMKLR
jgi:hypothetical protein